MTDDVTVTSVAPLSPEALARLRQRVNTSNNQFRVRQYLLAAIFRMWEEEANA